LTGRKFPQVTSRNGKNTKMVMKTNTGKGSVKVSVDGTNVQNFQVMDI
jgi:hypothetical protein